MPPNRTVVPAKVVAPPRLNCSHDALGKTNAEDAGQTSRHDTREESGGVGDTRGLEDGITPYHVYGEGRGKTGANRGRDDNVAHGLLLESPGGVEGDRDPQQPHRHAGKPLEV